MLMMILCLFCFLEDENIHTVWAATELSGAPQYFCIKFYKTSFDILYSQKLLLFNQKRVD